jgi:hypothetical protein
VTTAFALGVIVAALGVGLSFVWWMFSGAAAWIEPEDPPPPPLPRISYPEDYSDD